MRSTIFLLATLLIASPLPVLAACQSNSTTTSINETKIIVPFAVPIGLPVATFAPYFYSAAQFQPLQTNNPAHASTDNGPLTTDKGATTGDLVTAHCSSCHSGPTPKAGLSLDHPNSLSLTDRLRTIRAIASGQMPKGTHLTDNEIRALIEQLSATTH